MPNRDELQELVERWSGGEDQAFDPIVEILYDDLRSLAHRHLGRERGDHTLSTTALVNEAYIDLAKRTGFEWRGRARFLALVSRIMRHVLIDYARRHRALRRGGGQPSIPLDEERAGEDAEIVELLPLGEALDRLGERDQRLLRVVECRFFGGMADAEIAEAVGVSTRTVERDWVRARAYLSALLASPVASDRPRP